VEFIQSIFNPLTIQHAATPRYVDELGLVLPLVMLPIGTYFFFRGRRQFQAV
jgi:hypothetical protein